MTRVNALCAFEVTEQQRREPTPKRWLDTRVTVSEWAVFTNAPMFFRSKITFAPWFLWLKITIATGFEKVLLWQRRL